MIIRLASRKPVAGTRLNTGHQLTNGMIWCTPLNEGGGPPTELISRRVLTNANTTWGPTGGLTFPTGTSATAYYRFGGSTIPFGGSDFTIFVNAAPTTAQAGALLSTAAPDSADGQFVSFWINLTPGQYLFRLADSSGAHNTTGTTTVVDGKTHNYVAVRRGTSIEIWWDGKLLETLSNQTFGTFSAQSFPSIALGATKAGGTLRQMVGPIHTSAVWGRALHPSEIQALNVNPWQIYNPPRMVLSPLVSSNGGATRPNRLSISVGVGL